jgi:hypothetical protein
MSHLKFNVDLVRALIKKGTCFTPSWPLLNNKKLVVCCEGLHFLFFLGLHINSLHISQACMQNMTKIGIFGKCLWWEKTFPTD